MRNLFTYLLLFIFVTNLCSGQEKQDSTAKETDSLASSANKEGITIIESFESTKKAINPLAPSKAAFLSSLLPGLGQVYNKRYWKVPLVYAAIGGSIIVYDDNNKNYKRFRTAFKRRQAGFIDDEFYDINDDNAEGQEPDFDAADLERQQERFQRDRDLWLVNTIVFYILNIVDANVDAHLKQFNIDDDLSLDFKPYLKLNEVTNSPDYGMALIIKF